MADRGSPPPRWWPDGEPWPPARFPARRHHFRRRLLVAASTIMVLWVLIIAIMGAAAGLWQGRGPDGGRFVVGLLSIALCAGVVFVYRSVSGPVGDLLDATEHIADGNYAIDVESRGFRELRLLTETFNEMAARLAADEEQRRRFLADITHELRNPLAVLRSEIEAQLDGIHPRDDLHLSSLLAETLRLERLVDDLHTLALAETGRLILQPTVISLGMLAQQIVDRHAAQAHQNDVTLSVEITPDATEVSVDPARLRQVLDNLLANAIRHTPPGGQVLVAVGSSARARSGVPRSVWCRVSDAGPGIPAADLDNVFDRFIRAGDSRGSGLGLSIARDLIRAHGGTIHAANDAATGGASVTFSLPSAGAGHYQGKPVARWSPITAP